MNERLVALASALIEAPSPNPPGDERAVADVVRAALRERGLPVPAVVEAMEGRVNLLVGLDFGPGGAHLGLSGHLDTKPVGPAPWSVPPLTATCDGDRLYGRGSADMKGAVAAMIEAAAVLAADPPARGRLTLVLTADEEQGSTHGARALAEAHAVDCDALVIGEPGGIERDWDRLHVVSRGIACLRVVVRGDQGHSSLSDELDAVNASVELARLLAAMADDFRPSSPPCELEAGALRPTVNAGVELAGGLGFGVTPGEASFAVDVRTLPGMERERFARELEDFLAAQRDANPRLRAEVRFEPPPRDWLAATAVEAGAPVVRAARGALESVLGAVPPTAAFPGATDAAWLQAVAGIPTLPALGPGLLRRAHAADEWVSIRALEQARDVYVALARRFCPGEP